jgi:outer membrane protein assembly factor BamB
MLAAGSARALDWGTPGLDAAHARLSNEVSGALFADGRWSAPALDGVKALASPVVADGFAVTVDLDGVVRAIHADTGVLAWQVTLKMAVQGTPAVVQGRVYVPTLDSQLVALRLLDGTQVWTHQLDGMVMSSPVAIDDDVVLAAGFPQQHVERLSRATGEQIWRSPPVMDQFSNTSPAVGGGLVVVGSNAGRYYALDAVTGLLKWEYIADGIVNLAAPLIVGSRVYMAGGDQSANVHAVDLATGAPAPGWPIALPSPDPDIAGTQISRRRAISSFASAGGVVALETRLDDALDTDADGVADQFLSRETVVGLDPSSGALAWQFPVARTVRTDGNDVPGFFVSPTPAAYLSDRGAPLLAVASSLDPSITVLDAASGGQLARNTVAGPALASPVVANGMLFATALDGTVQGLVSSLNHAPAAAIPADSARPYDAAEPTVLRWLPATDPDAEQPSYELRIDTDGEVLESWQERFLLDPGVTSTTLTGLTTGVTYSYAIRARDTRGALSPWSAIAHFTLVTNPAVTVNGASAGSLSSAVASAQPGDVIGLGAGIYTLTQTLTVGAGVSIQGAGAARTRLDATGLATGVNFTGKDPAHGAGLDGVTVSGADTCVNVADGATGVRITHAIVRDCRTNGVTVSAAGGADLVNTTIVSNPMGLIANGTTRVKNSLLTRNGVALTSATTGALTSSYDNLVANQTDYAGLTAGTGDMSQAIAFVDFTGHNLLLASAQASTDRGDPVDSVGAEPAPNGARINLGAFGGTADAETSASSTSVGPSGPASTPAPAVGGSSGESNPSGSEAGGCAVGGPVSAGGSLAWVLLAVLVRRRRRGG